MTNNLRLEPKYSINTYYAITIQPDDKIQNFSRTPTARIMAHRQIIYSILQDCKVPYYINLEISEPIGSLANKSSGGRLHWHGIITFKKKQHIRDFLLEIQYKLLRVSRLEISKINDKTSWWNYINKQKLIPHDIRLLTNYDPDIFYKEYSQP